STSILHTIDKSQQKSDIYYNPWADNFDQKNQQSVLNALPIEEIPIEPEADTKNIENTQDPWEIFEETIVASGQALEYPNNGLSDKWELNSDEESLYLISGRSKEPPTYHIKDLINIRLDQIQQLLKLRVNQLRLKKVLFILNEMQYFLYPNLLPPLQHLNRDFYKLYEAKTKKAQDRLLKQVLRKVRLCKNMKIKGFILTKKCHC
ncbi:44708_t:CDS:2, partial [Gigaspora margarita]